MNPTPRTARAARMRNALHWTASAAFALALGCGPSESPSPGAPGDAPAPDSAAADANAKATGDGKPVVRGAAEVLREDPCVVEARAMISEALHGAKRYAEQLKLLEGGVQSCPDRLEYRNDLAYLLATLPEDSLRDGKRALELAKAIVARDAEDPAYLDTLAAAHAENGNFEDAVKASDAALAILAKSQAPAEIVQIFQTHRDAFAAKKPIRE